MQNDQLYTNRRIQLPAARKKGQFPQKALSPLGGAAVEAIITIIIMYTGSPHREVRRDTGHFLIFFKKPGTKRRKQPSEKTQAGTEELQNCNTSFPRRLEKREETGIIWTKERIFPLVFRKRISITHEEISKVLRAEKILRQNCEKTLAICF